jgi:hypothetical protein
VQQGDQPSITVRWGDGREEVLLSDRLPKSLSDSIFMKRGEVAALYVTMSAISMASGS